MGIQLACKFPGCTENLESHLTDHTNQEQKIGLPTRNERAEVLNTYTKTVKFASDVNLEKIAVMTSGLNIPEIDILLSEAMDAAVERTVKDNPSLNFKSLYEDECYIPDLSIKHCDFELAIHSVEPSLEVNSPEAKEEEYKEEEEEEEKEGREGSDIASIENENILSPSHRITKFKQIDITRPLVTFDDVAGCDAILKKIQKYILCMKYVKNYKEFQILPRYTFLFRGPQYSGRALLARAMANELNIPLLKVSARHISIRTVEEVEQQIRNIFDQAVAAAPCILLIEEIEIVFGDIDRDDITAVMKQNMLSTFLSCKNNLRKRENIGKVMLVFKLSRENDFESVMDLEDSFDREIIFTAPDEENRLKILRKLTKNVSLSHDVNLKEIAHLTEGYHAIALKMLIIDATAVVIERYLREGLNSRPQNLHEIVYVNHNDIKALIDETRAVDCTDRSPQSPLITWNSIGIFASLREMLHMTILTPMREAKFLRHLGLHTASGLLLCGPSGCGKTIYAHVIANEGNVNLVCLKSREIMNQCNPDFEMTVRKRFMNAKIATPCILYIDDLDYMCNRARKDKKLDMEKFLIAQMDSMRGHGIFFLGSTRNHESIDPELMKPGRLEKILYIGAPTLEDRMNMLKALTQNSVGPKLEDNIDIKGICERCEGFTLNDIALLVKEAKCRRLSEVLNIVDESVKVNTDNFIQALPHIEMIKRRLVSKLFIPLRTLV